MLLSCASSTANCVWAVNATCAWMAVFAWGYMLHEQDASAQLVPSCNAGKGRRDSHWRQPCTSDSLAFGSEIKTRNHPIGRATDIFPCSGCFCGTIYYQGSLFFLLVAGLFVGVAVCVVFVALLCGCCCFVFVSLPGRFTTVFTISSS